MWVAFAFGSALFAGITSILAKCGIKTTDSNVATAIRTIAVLIMAWVMVLVVGSADQISSVTLTSWAFLILSGLATGASWLCYFRALQIGDVSRVVPVDKTSTILTMILAFVVLGEPISALKVFCMVLIGAGTLLMAWQGTETKTGKEEGEEKSLAWLPYAIGSAVFAALTSILGKVGIEGVESNLGTAIRTGVVLVMAWVMVFVTGHGKDVRRVPRGELAFILLSGLATGASWLCYYRALQEGPASVVVPIDKLSIVVTVVFSRIVLGERIDRRQGLGLALVVAGTLLMLV